MTDWIGTTGSDPLVDLKTNGKVGIGTTAPSARTHIRTYGVGDVGLIVDNVTNEDIAQFKEDGTTKVVIDANGNVGIGTTAPSARTHIRTYGAGDIGLIVDHVTNEDIAQFKKDESPKVVIDANGNVGIGIDSPLHKLHIADAIAEKEIHLEATTGTNAAYMVIENTGGNMFIGRDSSEGNRLMSAGAYTGGIMLESNHALAFGTNNTTRMFIQNNGNVGIGTTSSATKLVVNGDILAQDIRPLVHNTYDLGSSICKWANVWVADLHLANEKGDWTIQEETDAIIVINNKTGKRYKMVLDPLDE